METPTLTCHKCGNKNRFYVQEYLVHEANISPDDPTVLEATNGVNEIAPTVHCWECSEEVSWEGEIAFL